ncbi:uncharacterized protein LOC143461797 isoform X2 [Clavelina lepadiformis]|uniref:uncharacterized protein LOC143461797 isoform X2 n=1 Tax=Clavelina lepadiformis TaxID=159417 RepID=UPI00404295EE
MFQMEGLTVSDADPFPTFETEGKPKAKKKTEKTTKGSYTEGSGRSSKFKSRPFWEEEDFGPPQYQEVATDGSVPRKYVKSTFKIRNCDILNANIAGQGPVDMETSYQRYQPGSKKSNLKVSGGEFNQTTLGGDATYKNDSSVIGAGTGAGVGTVPGLIDIDKVQPPFSPESYIVKLLQTKISSENLVKLLEKKYGVVRLAHSIPKSANKREEMIHTLLKIADMEEMEG